MATGAVLFCGILSHFENDIFLIRTTFSSPDSHSVSWLFFHVFDRSQVIAITLLIPSGPSSSYVVPIMKDIKIRCSLTGCRSCKLHRVLPVLHFCISYVKSFSERIFIPAYSHLHISVSTLFLLSNQIKTIGELRKSHVFPYCVAPSWIAVHPITWKLPRYEKSCCARACRPNQHRCMSRQCPFHEHVCITRLAMSGGPSPYSVRWPATTSLN